MLCSYAINRPPSSVLCFYYHYHYHYHFSLC